MATCQTVQAAVDRELWDPGFRAGVPTDGMVGRKTALMAWTYPPLPVTIDGFFVAGW